MSLKPSHYSSEHPWSSVFQNNETETIFRNILVILDRTGDDWRDLDWDEYKFERAKDGSFTNSEKEYFDKVIVYAHPERVFLFSPKYKEIYQKESKLVSEFQQV